jgi:hypothetical protein
LNRKERKERKEHRENGVTTEPNLVYLGIAFLRALCVLCGSTKQAAARGRPGGAAVFP